jgi:hypothetical protein
MRQELQPRAVRIALAATVATVASLWIGGAHDAAAIGPPIGPKQHYIGLVNGKHKGAAIDVVCPGPAGGTRTGPPAGNQTVSVRRVRSGGGDTGSVAHEIWAQVGKDARHVVGFTHYASAKRIPSALRLPCQGTGTVTFTTCFGTQPCAANARNDRVTVRFVNIAA